MHPSAQKRILRWVLGRNAKRKGNLFTLKRSAERRGELSRRIENLNRNNLAAPVKMEPKTIIFVSYSIALSGRTSRTSGRWCVDPEWRLRPLHRFPCLSAGRRIRAFGKADGKRVPFVIVMGFHARCCKNSVGDTIGIPSNARIRSTALSPVTMQAACTALAQARR